MLKLKDKYKNGLFKICLLILGILIIFTTVKNIINNKNYKETNEYKLIELGYSKEDITIILNSLSDEQINLINEKNNYLIEFIKIKNFDITKLSRYTNTQKEKGFSYYKTVLYVNLDKDLDIIKEADLSLENLIIVNENNYLNKDYVPNNLVKISKEYSWGDNQKMDSSAYSLFKSMQKVAKENGFTLMINDSYKECTLDKCTSEYQTGLLINVSDYYKSKRESCESWLIENSYKYGFIQRYPDYGKDITGNESTKLYRYVGKDAARIIHDNNITLEEYVINYK